MTDPNNSAKSGFAKFHGRYSVGSGLLLAVLLPAVLLLVVSLYLRLSNQPVDPTVNWGTDKRVVQVNIVNASGISGVARGAMDYLRHRGFDVVEISTLEDSLELSRVFDRVGSREGALKVASVMGLHDSLVLTNIDTLLYLDATLEIGLDYKSLKPFRD